MCESGRYLMVYRNHSTLISGEADNEHSLQCPYKPMKVKINAMEENQKGTSIHHSFE